MATSNYHSNRMATTGAFSASTLAAKGTSIQVLQGVSILGVRATYVPDGIALHYSNGTTRTVCTGFVLHPL